LRFLLTSAGITNATIDNALVDLLGKPIAESSALCIPTGVQPFAGGPSHVYRFISGSAPGPMCELGWKSLGLLELTALPSMKKELWFTMLQETDALLVGGGDCQYLCYWMQQSGLAQMLPSLLHKTVYVGLSAGSMIMTRYGTTYGNHTLPTESDKCLGIVDFALHPHLDHKSFPKNSLANQEKLAATISVPSYMIDDNTAIKVTDGNIEVISEGQWKLFTPDKTTNR